MKYFPGQQPDEGTLLVLHRHWFPFVTEAARIFLLAILPLAILFGWGYLMHWEFNAGTLSYLLMVMLGGIYYLFLAILLYGFWLDYYLDVFVVTNKRVVDIEQDGLFDRTVAEQPIDRIQDVTSEMKGVMAHVFRFGNVYIQTAGTKERFIFENVENPELVVKTILSLTDDIIKPRPETEAPLDTKPSPQTETKPAPKS